ncbi:MAG: hypothetical protein DHS80DRAFT_30346 [Piptocephalis tieghemiana]|nr:MAG: hypothetical protein DHS80DRAFT_30346 [Piptocephalis tieghemiana]
MRHHSCFTVLSAALLLATGSTVQAADATFKDCRIGYSYKEITYYGGTTDDNGTPWCVMTNHPAKQDWGTMDISTVPTIPARTDAGEDTTCITTGYPVTVPRNDSTVTFTVYGCYSTTPANPRLRCKTTSGAMGQCLGITPTEFKKNANGDAKVVAGKDANAAENALDKAAGGSSSGDEAPGNANTVGYIVGPVIGAAVVIAAVGLLVHRRRQQSLQDGSGTKEAGSAAGGPGGFLNQGWGALKGGVSGFRNRASGMIPGGGASRAAGGHQHDLAEAAFPAGNAISPTGIVFATANESPHHSASSSAHNSMQLSSGGSTGHGGSSTAHSSTLITPPGASSASSKIYPVVSTYTPTLGDELEIQPGDQVQIVVEYDDGWCQGLNLSRGNAKGVFPKHCVDMSQGSENYQEE